MLGRDDDEFDLDSLLADGASPPQPGDDEVDDDDDDDDDWYVK